MHEFFSRYLPSATRENINIFSLYFLKRRKNMTKKTRKHAFTVVELVIVIAVVAILAAILIPTFSNVFKKADESAAFHRQETC